jgi:lipopolysaccharide export system protein LptC
MAALPPVATRAAPTPRRQPWHWRVIETVSAYLPLLLMALLAVATWWLVQATPMPEEPRSAPLLAQDPDHTLLRFVLQRFAADGHLTLRLEGNEMRHFPDRRVYEVDEVRVRAIGDDGGLTLARARQAVANDEGTEVELRGGAEVTHVDAGGGEPIEFRGEYLHAFLDTRRLRSHLPVTLVQGRSEIRAAGVEVDAVAKTAHLTGPLKATFDPQQGTPRLPRLPRRPER